MSTGRFGVPFGVPGDFPNFVEDFSTPTFLPLTKRSAPVFPQETVLVREGAPACGVGELGQILPNPEFFEESHPACAPEIDEEHLPIVASDEKVSGVAILMMPSQVMHSPDQSCDGAGQLLPESGREREGSVSIALDEVGEFIAFLESDGQQEGVPSGTAVGDRSLSGQGDAFPGSQSIPFIARTDQRNSEPKE